MLFVELVEGMLSMELAKAVDDWLWRNGKIDNMLEVGLGYFGKLVVERVKDKMENIASSEGGHYTVWLTSLGVDCCGGFSESYSIFFIDSRKMGQSLVRWSVSLQWYMQYRGLTV
jgi:hypothetical protein